MRTRHRRIRSPAGRRLVSPGGGAFNPTMIAGLTLWLDPTFGLFQERTGASATTPAAADGDPVGTWAARSGGVYLTAPSDAARPTVQTVGGKRVVRFDGVDDHLTWAGVAVDAGFFALLAVDQTGDNGLVGNAGSGNPQLRIGQSANVLSTFDSTGNNPQSAELDIAQGNWSRVGFHNAGTVMTFYQNNITYGTGTFDGTETFGAVGAIGPLPTIPLSGDLADLVFYEPSPSSADITRLDAWMAGRHP